MDETHEHHDGPTEQPIDPDEERNRLLADAAEAGVDGEAAVHLAEQVAHGTPLADAYRAVDRRIASGSSLDEAEAVLLDGEGTGHAGDAADDA